VTDRIVLNTNVLVSALLVQGSVPDQVLNTVIAGRTQVVVDGRIMREYRTVLARPEFGFAPERIDDLLLLFDHSEWIIAAPLAVEIPDETDLPFLEVAVAAGVDALVTGNPRHFRLRDKPLDIPVLTPREYVDWMAGRE
jgi:uncharacterized protein